MAQLRMFTVLLRRLARHHDRRSSQRDRVSWHHRNFAPGIKPCHGHPRRFERRVSAVANWNRRRKFWRVNALYPHIGCLHNCPPLRGIRAATKARENPRQSCFQHGRGFHSHLTCCYSANASGAGRRGKRSQRQGISRGKWCPRPPRWAAARPPHGQVPGRREEAIGAGVFSSSDAWRGMSLVMMASMNGRWSALCGFYGGSFVRAAACCPIAILFCLLSRWPTCTAMN